MVIEKDFIFVKEFDNFYGDGKRFYICIRIW